MQQSSLLSVLLPVALGIIMLGVGLSLTVDDFRRVAKYPKAMTVALVCQMVIMPAMCFFLVLVFDLDPMLGVGLMLLAASPGGATSNLYSHLSNGDVALNITLTAVNSVLTLFTLPLIVNFSLGYFLSSDQYVPIQFAKVIEVFAIVLVPVSIGMLLKNRAAGFAAKMDKPVKIMSVIFLVMIIVAVVMREHKVLTDNIGTLGLPILIFNVLSMAVGYYVPQWLNIGKKQAIAMGMEIGLHNGTLAIYIALNVLNNSTMSVPPAIYGILMFFTAAAFGYLVNVGKKEVAVGS